MYNETICFRCNVSAASYTYVKNRCINTGCSTHNDSGYNNHYDSGYNNHYDSGCGHYVGGTYKDYSGSYGDGYYGDTTYSVCGDYCSTHSDSGCSTHSDSGYSNHSDSGYSDYKNCTNSCLVQWTYGNYGNDSAPNKGNAYSFSWSASNWNGNALVPEYIKDSESAMIELRNNIAHLVANKGRNKVSGDLVTTTNAQSGNATFDAGDIVDDLQYMSLRNTLDNLYQDLKQASSGLVTVSLGTLAKKVDIESIKQKITTLAGDTITYSNCNNSNYSNNSGYNNTGAPNSSYVDAGVCNQYKNGAAYTNYSDVRYR